MLERIAPLFVIIGLGSLCGAVRLFPSNDTAIGVLNRFALYIGFPLLIVGALGSDDLTLPLGPGYYALHVIGAAVMLAVVFAVTAVHPSLRAERGSITLGTLFGNIAYLGIPFCRSVLGEQAAGLAALSAAIHIALAMALGPFLLLRWNRSAGRVPMRDTLRRVVAQPLVWAPVAGLLIRAAPSDLRGAILSVAQPVGAAAGPIALFMLGLYLFAHRRRILDAGAGAVAASSLKLAVYPAVAFALVHLTARLWLLTDVEPDVLVLQAAMPVAITTFALAEEYRTGRDLLACGIVVSTVAALVVLPLIASL